MNKVHYHGILQIFFFIIMGAWGVSYGATKQEGASSVKKQSINQNNRKSELLMLAQNGLPPGNEEDVQAYVDAFMDRNDELREKRKKRRQRLQRNKPVKQRNTTTTRNVPIKKTLQAPSNKKARKSVVRKVRSTLSIGRSADTSYERRRKSEVNKWAVGLAAGHYASTPTRMASELASVLDNGSKLNVIPMITRGSLENANSLLFMQSVDLAIVNADVLNYYKNDPRIQNIKNRVNYITQLSHSAIHVLARPEIETLDDLFGKIVNFNIKGSAASYTGPEIFKRLGVSVKESYLSFEEAVQDMKKNDGVSAVVFLSNKSNRVLRQTRWPNGFRLIPVKYSQNLTDYYLPTVLTHDDYPKLVKRGRAVETIAVPALLVAYNWRQNTPRYQKVARFVDTLFERWERLKKAPYHENWRSINLSARAPGWNRLPIVQVHLAKHSRKKLASGFNRPADYELRKQFEVFLRKYAKAKNIKGFTKRQREQLFILFSQHLKEK